MEKILKSESVADAPVKQKYVKPTMQTHELETETSILTGMDSSLPGYPAKADEMVNPFGETFTDLKA